MFLPSGEETRPSFTEEESKLRQGKNQKSPKSQRLGQTRTQSTTPVLSSLPRKPCTQGHVHTCMCVRVPVSTCVPQLPCAASLKATCAGSLAGAGLFQAVPPCGSGEQRGHGWRGLELHLHFSAAPWFELLQTQASSCCVLS